METVVVDVDEAPKTSGDFLRLVKSTLRWRMDNPLWSVKNHKAQSMKPHRWLTAERTGDTRFYFTNYGVKIMVALAEHFDTPDYPRMNQAMIYAWLVGTTTVVRTRVVDTGANRPKPAGRNRPGLRTLGVADHLLIKEVSVTPGSLTLIDVTIGVQSQGWTKQYQLLIDTKPITTA